MERWLLIEGSEELKSELVVVGCGDQVESSCHS
jgi:hypothetical protein